jgi:pimeloyl-ACP methyl ester carboxylesterase
LEVAERAGAPVPPIAHVASFIAIGYLPEAAMPQTTVLLLGGIGNDYRYWAPWIPALTPNGRVLGLTHELRGATIDSSARIVADQIRELPHTGRLVIIAHSMGGLVAKRALDILGSETAAYATVELRAYGTPWGGFWVANFARWLPLFNFVSDAFGLAMGPEIGTSSPFMEALKRPLEGNTSLTLVESEDDGIARPVSLAGREQYAAIRSLASQVLTLRGVGHDDYAMAITPEHVATSLFRQSRAAMPIAALVPVLQ